MRNSLGCADQNRHDGRGASPQQRRPSQPPPEAAFRQAVHKAMHIGTALVWATQHDDVDTVQRGKRDLRAAVETLQSYRT